MEGQLMSWIISLISGGVGGNIAGALMKDKSLGLIGNTIAGLLGGGIGGQLLGAVLGGDMLSGIAGNIGSSGVGGAILLIIVSLIKNAMSKK
jgi:uncharacterized membrane protein YeaQ/YmgE (transglycosylase-associated protein family)